jgi:hypothetical protein
VNPREFQIEDHHVQFQGRCARCGQKPRARPRRKTRRGSPQRDQTPE